MVSGSAEVCFCPQQPVWHFVPPVTSRAPDHQHRYTTRAVGGGLSKSLCPQPTNHTEKTFELAQSGLWREYISLQTPCLKAQLQLGRAGQLL